VTSLSGWTRLPQRPRLVPGLIGALRLANSSAVRSFEKRDALWRYSAVAVFQILRTGVIGLTASLALIATAPSVAAKPGPQGPGCDPSRPAVAHYAGAVAAPGTRASAPVPCEAFVGTTSESAVVGVTDSGSLFYAPLLENTSPPPQNTLQGPELVVRSRDLGATWTPLNTQSPATGGLVPPWMSIDPQTSRIWFVRTLPKLCGARIDWSDDEGESWQTNPSVGCNAPGELAQGGEKLIEGPPPAGGEKPVGYPHVVYYCANGVDTLASNLYCYKSLDGGQTFAFTHVFPDPPLPPGCVERHPSRPGVVGTDGVLYFPTVLCGALGVAISHDEGASWQFRPIVDSGLQDIYTTGTTVDSHGNLYFAYRGPGALPYLTFSTDGAASWSTPIMVAPPGVQAVRRVAVTARRRGEVALSYLGTTDGSHFNGYITQSHNVLTGKPRFWSASVNDPSEPLVNAADSETFGDRFFYGGDAIAPDGTVWAGFHCAKTSACPGGRVGVVGRLTR
jgi:hypothetical protein